MQVQAASYLDRFRDSLIGLVHSILLMPVFLYFMSLNRVEGERYILLFFLLTQVSAVLFRKGWFYFLAQVIHIGLFLYQLFPPEGDTLSIAGWIRESWTNLTLQWTELMQADLIGVPYLLIYSLLITLISLLTYLAIHKKLALPSFLTGFIYLMVVHTFSSQPVLPEIVQVVGFGFLLIALMKLNINGSWGNFLNSFLVTSLITGTLIFLSFLGISRLESSQQWVEAQLNPYQRTLSQSGFFDWITSYSTGLGYRRTGFSLDDSRLGGPLQQDFTPLFRAYTDDPQYWKVMHQTTYTGTGWDNPSTENEVTRTVYSPYSALLRDTADPDSFNLMKELDSLSTVPVYWYEPMTYIAYPYGFTDLELNDNSSNYSMELNDQTDFLDVVTQDSELFGYQVSYSEEFLNKFNNEAMHDSDGWRDNMTDNYHTVRKEWAEKSNLSQEELNELAEEEENMTRDDIMAELFPTQLQLPDDLPERVVDLAHSITEGIDSEYDMVRAIETYLKEEGGYRYSLLEVETTPPDGDYVDHFLFDSMIGYCNNFSTAMVVMLRAVGIPARWAKGFTPGDAYVDENDQTYFQVSNANSHSWPEVFFPGMGWIPFEPSPSFEQPVTHPTPVAASVGNELYSVEEDDFIDLEEVNLADDQEADTAVEEEEGEESGLAPAEEDYSDEGGVEDSALDSIDWTIILEVLILVGLIVLSLFLLLRRQNTIYELIKWIIQTGKWSLDQSIRFILWLFSFKLEQEPGHTLEDYLNHWYAFLPKNSDTMNQFIQLANDSFYGPLGGKHPMTPEEEAVILDMLRLFISLPSLKDIHKDAYPLR
ncbi:transglutaminase-like domain-containing protein [Alkalibacterium sp. MB6]|uniref:transglutaminase-like domain-containing protein n=1 Tax=Alkalibacterium sp. MB6 TaxID=2081965 RepID=UPI001379AF2B|nr:transglutaminase-like domain-containing protein [Alkalibacterium sp. MB6]